MRTNPSILVIAALTGISGPMAGAFEDGPRAGGQPPAEHAQEPAPTRPLRDQARRRMRAELESSRERLNAAVRLLDEGADLARVREEAEKAAPWRSSARTRGQRAEPQGRDGPGPGDRAGTRPPSGEARFDISPGERTDILRFLDENAPRVGARLRELDLTTPDLVTRLLARMRPRIREVMESGPNDPELRDLRLDEFRASLDVMWARRALDEARAGGDETRINEKRDDLRNAIGLHFDAQAALQEHEADRLVQRVERLRKDLADRRRDRASIVEREMDGHWTRGGDHPAGVPKRDGRDSPDAAPDRPR